MFERANATVNANKKQANRTGIPNAVKERFENKSGFSFDDVRIHYNSDKPAQLQAFAYTQGNQVYIAPGQERCLGHELGHVVQQKRGEVRPTVRYNGVGINDDTGLEKEADDLYKKPFKIEQGKMQHATNSVAQLMKIKELMSWGSRWWDISYRLKQSGSAGIETKPESQPEHGHQYNTRGIGQSYETEKVTRDTTKGVIDEFNPQFKDLGFILRGGWMPYDPVIRCVGKRARAYKDIVKDLNKNAIMNAELFINFWEDKSELESLPEPLREFAVIVFVAEVGRGYTAGLGVLRNIVEHIRGGVANWMDVLGSFSATIPYKRDTDYKPEGSMDVESEEESFDEDKKWIADGCPDDFSEILARLEKLSDENKKWIADGYPDDVSKILALLSK
jgi:hypothetical protein